VSSPVRFAAEIKNFFAQDHLIQLISARIILVFFLLNIIYLFALLNLCRSLLRQKIVYVHCLLVTRASSYMAYSRNSGKIFKLHVICAMPFITIF